MLQQFVVALVAAAAMSLPGAHAASLELNPETPVGNLITLDKDSPMFGARPSPQMARYVVKAEHTLTRAQIYEEVARNGSASARTTDTTNAPATNNSANDAGNPSRLLEVTSGDVARLESFFGQPMVKNVDTIQQQYSKSEFKPAPWPSSYWPTYADSINAKWDGSNPSPAEKYATAYNLNVQQFMDKVSSNIGIDSQAGWSRACSSNGDCAGTGGSCAKRAGRNSGYCIPGWYGICHAWAPASILEPEPKCNVVKNGVTFKPFDIKALLTAIYDGASIQVVFTGARYDGSGSGYDEYGRAKDAAERDLGPGFFHIAVTNIMGRFGKSFIVDVVPTAEVWNQPVRSYEIVQMTKMSPSAAAQTYFNVPAYPFNNAAVKVAYVHMVFRYVNEMVRDGPLVSTGIVDQVTVSVDYKYLLELDASNNIIGGEWVDSSRQRHPDFLWFTPYKPGINTVTALGLSYKEVQALLTASIACGTDPDPQDPGKCGNDQTGPKPCPNGQYCQPWNPTFYECRTIPAKCGKQEVGVDYYGDDIKMAQLLLPEQCCDLCHATAGCKAYTFINYNPDGKAYCYLKKGTGQKTNKVGAVSAVIVSSDSDKCNPQEIGIDYYGDDLSSAYASSAGDCCNKCSALSGCKAYTYISSDSACYMKKGTGSKTNKAGAVSATIKGATTCSTPLWGNCGNANSGASCCPDGAYCQPWDTRYYQCILKPAKCSRQYTNVDFYGDDIKSVFGIGPGECCDRCVATSGCKAYTFVNDNYNTPACYLKKGTGQQRSHPSAVSGLVN